MPAIDRGLDRLTFLPEALRDALRRRLRELGGLALIMVATLLALALATWSVQDPSLSHATNAPVRNVLGVSGAIVADLLIQLLRCGCARAGVADRHLGLAARDAPAAHARAYSAAVLRSRGATGRRLHRGAPAQPGLAAAVSLGGVIGDWMLRFPALLAGGTLSGLARTAVAIVTGAGTLVCFAIAAGVGWRSNERHVEEAVEDEGERGIPYRSAGSPTVSSVSRPGSRAL